MSLYLDGALAAYKTACAAPPCGDVLYPQESPGGACAPRTPFTIGTYLDRSTGSQYPHVGGIKSARVFSRALRLPEVALLHGMHANALRGSAMPPTDYWVKLPARGAVGGVSSPTVASSLAVDASQNLGLYGAFWLDQVYRCRFSFGEMSAPSQDATVSQSAFSTAPPGHGDVLSCPIAPWAGGYKAATLTVERWETAASRWVTLWQKACLSAACGYLPPAERAVSSWWMTAAGSARRLNGGLRGTKTRHVFTVESGVYKFDPASESLAPLHVFPIGDADSGVLGASSATVFEADGARWVAFANYWDGYYTSVRSPLFRLDGAGAALAFAEVQSVPSSGAREWVLLRVGARPFLALANFIGGVDIFPWRNGTAPDAPKLDEARAARLDGTDGAAGLAAIELGEVTLLAVARHPGLDGAPVRSVVVSLSADAEAGSAGVVDAQELDTSDAYAVSAHHAGGAWYLVFASMGAGGSPLFAWGTDPVRGYLWGQGSAAPHFSALQTLPTTRAAALHAFAWQGTRYLLVAQVEGPGSQLFRWNGTHMLAAVDEDTLPDAASGGQLLAGLGALSAVALEATPPPPPSPY